LPPPPDEPVSDSLPPSRYPDQTAANTRPTWLQDPQGQPRLTADVEANLEDLKGYSINLNEIQGNFGEMARSVADPLRSAVAGAFPVGADNGLEWQAAMNSLATYNAYQFQSFVFNMALGIRNVASAAQAVANSYGNTDDTSAASLGAINFAFGDKSQAPSGFPSWALEQLPTWAEVSARNPPVPPADVPTEGLPPGAVSVTTQGGTTTTTVQLPGGGTMVTTEESWGAFGFGGTTTTVTVNGKVMSTSSSFALGGATFTQDRQNQYDADGNPQGERVVSSGGTVVGRDSDGSEHTQQWTTTYEYDENGQATPSTSGSSVTVGPERPTEEAIPHGEDPAQQALEELMPEPDDDEPMILAPGENAPGSGDYNPYGTETV
jgi:hypothetical protein